MKDNDDKTKSQHQILKFEGKTKISVPLFLSTIKAGFPSPADDYQEERLDFNEYLVSHPAATFCLRVSGDSMINAGIRSGDILVVDRAITPSDNRIVVAIINGELTVKRISKHADRLLLIPDNPEYEPIVITEEMNFEIWGVVTHVIHSLV